eukprot:m.710533 g.710533  ORF g.710533 m.710533 type:complete len:369 (+) comp58761_c1_seq1:1108-2214(+)
MLKIPTIKLPWPYESIWPLLLDEATVLSPLYHKFLRRSVALYKDRPDIAGSQSSIEVHPHRILREIGEFLSSLPVVKISGFSIGISLGGDPFSGITLLEPNASLHDAHESQNSSRPSASKIRAQTRKPLEPKEDDLFGRRRINRKHRELGESALLPASDRAVVEAILTNDQPVLGTDYLTLNPGSWMYLFFPDSWIKFLGWMQTLHDHSRERFDAGDRDHGILQPLHRHSDLLDHFQSLEGRLWLELDNATSYFYFRDATKSGNALPPDLQRHLNNNLSDAKEAYHDFLQRNLNERWSAWFLLFCEANELFTLYHKFRNETHVLASSTQAQNLWAVQQKLVQGRIRLLRMPASRSVIFALFFLASNSR